MSNYLEHANLTVRNLDEAVRFIGIAFPEFKVRGQGVNHGQRWLHIGTQTSYLALSEEERPETGRNPYRDSGFNHLGFTVDDAEGIRKRLLAAGYREGLVPPPHPFRKRVYVHDADGLEWEFVQYLTDDPAQRNDYSQ